MVLLTQSQDSNYGLSAQMNNARNISLMIKAIHFKDVSEGYQYFVIFKIYIWVSNM